MTFWRNYPLFVCLGMSLVAAPAAAQPAASPNSPAPPSVAVPPAALVPAKAPDFSGVISPPAVVEPDSNAVPFSPDDPQLGRLPFPVQAEPQVPSPSAATALPAEADRALAQRPSRAGAVELTWLGHAAWLLRSPAGTTVLIDPWLTNPRAPTDFVMPAQIDAILVSHGHADHLGETAALARKYHAPVVGSHELIEQLGLEHGIGSNPGGTVRIKDLTVHLTQSVHSSSFLPPPPDQAAVGCGCAGEHDGAASVPPAPPVQASVEASTMAHGGAKPGHSSPAPEAGGHVHEHGRNEHGNGRHGHHDHHGHDHHRGHHPHPAAPAKGPTAGKDELPVAHGELIDPAKLPPQAGACAACDHGAQACTEHGAQGASPAGACEACGGESHGCDGHESHGHGPHMQYGGAALGFVIEVQDGPTLYHAGDTDVFGDMRLIARRYHPQVALLPIGGHYTMDAQGAALASHLLGVQDVLPMHYGTIPQLTGTPAELASSLSHEVRMVAPSPGARVSFVARGQKP